MVAFLSQKSDQYHGVYIRDETDVQFSPSLRELLRKTFISSLQRIGLLLQMSLDGSASALGRCQQPSKLQNPGTKCFVCRDNRPDVASGVTLVELYRCNHVEGTGDRHESAVMLFRVDMHKMSQPPPPNRLV